MAFILSGERDGDSVTAFSQYYEYLRKHKNSIPNSAYVLASSKWWHDFNEHKCPHDAWLESFVVNENSSGDRGEIRSTDIEVKLLASYHDGFIKLKYKGVISFKVDAFNVVDGHSNWRYDEFRVSDSGLFFHEIEWSGYQESSTWLIEAKEIEFDWCKKDT